MSAVPTRVPDQPVAEPSRPSSRAQMVLVAAVALVALEAVRASGPLLDRVVAEGGVIAAAVTALIVYAAPALLGALVGGVGARRAAAFSVVALVVLRLATQVSPTFLLGTTLVAVAVAAVVLVVRQAALAPSDPVSAVTGLVLGGAADVALRALLATWDPVWRPGIIPWVVVLLECAVLVYALAQAQRQLSRARDRRVPVGRVWLVGVHLALTTLVLGSPAFLASATSSGPGPGLGLPFAAVALLVGSLFAVEALSRSALPGGSGRWSDLSGAKAGGIAAGLLVLSVSVALLASGIWVVPAVLVGQVTAALALARALSVSLAPRAAPEPDEAWDRAERRAAERLDRLDFSPDDGDLTLTRVPVFGSRAAVGFGLAGLSAGLGYILVVLLYQIHYELPLPFPNWLIVVAAAALLGGAGLGERAWARDALPSPPRDSRPGSGRDSAPDSGRDSRRDERAAKRGGLAPLAALPAVLLLAPVILLVTTPAPAKPAATSSTFRMMSWNLHYAVNGAGAVDPEAIAVAIEKQRPDVVMLQEVSRGWPIGGLLDGAEWLSRRLGMPYVWAPAADGQFGNVILSRLRITEAQAAPLPQGDGSMERSYATATVELPGGRTVQMIDVHLAHRENGGATRAAQLKVLLDRWGEESPAVIAGDFNATPGSKEIKQLTSLGLVSAQDTTGHSGMLTSPTDRPQHRVDWIFGTPDVHFEDFARPGVRTSDHFPLAVTVVVG